jgi:hypothetical protein
MPHRGAEAQASIARARAYPGGMMLRMGSTAAWLAGAGATLALAACGGDGDDRTKLRTPGTEAARTKPSADPESAAAAGREADPRAVAIVRDWADTLRHGDVRGAARYFARPSLVSNGTSPIRLKTRADAVYFNRTLPCGAVVIDAEAAPHGFVIVRFRLTERPGKGSCGGGAGGTARVAFRVRKGHITDWLRVPDAAPTTGEQS